MALLAKDEAFLSTYYLINRLPRNVSRDVIFDKLVFLFANTHTPSFPSRPERISKSILLPSLSFPSNLPPHDQTSLPTHTHSGINDQLESREHTPDLPIAANLDLGGDASALQEHRGIKHLLSVSLDFNKELANQRCLRMAL